MLVHVLARAGADRDALERVVSERGIDPLLDDPDTFDAVVQERGVSQLPFGLASYILLRRCLLDAGVENRLLADYLTSVFLHFAQGRRAHRVAAFDDGEYHYLVDILRDISEADGRRAFLLRAHLGNFSLWLAGLFPDYIVRRVHRKGGPGLDYYEEMGQTGFSLAADDPFARRQRLDALYREAARAFSPMRRALNTFSDRYLTPSATSPDDRLLRQVRDDFESRRLQA